MKPIRCAALLWLAFVVPVAAADAASPASTVQSSRWWKLTCSEVDRRMAVRAPACLLTVRLRGRIDDSRRRLVELALQRGGSAARARGRRVDLLLDVDTRGGQVFAAMEIGRLLRRESASIRVASGSQCVSACLFVLMGAPERSVDPRAHIGMHRPSFGHAKSDELVDSMSAQIALYAQQMGVPRRIVDDMMAIPAAKVRTLTVEELAGYGIAVSGTSSARR